MSVTRRSIQLCISLFFLFSFSSVAVFAEPEKTTEVSPQEIAGKVTGEGPAPGATEAVSPAAAAPANAPSSDKTGEETKAVEVAAVAPSAPPSPGPNAEEAKAINPIAAAPEAPPASGQVEEAKEPMNLAAVTPAATPSSDPSEEATQGMGPAVAAPEASPSADRTIEEIDTAVLKPGDVIFIEVSPQREMSASKQIDESGLIYMSYLGDIRAEGLLPAQLASSLQEALGAKYLQNPTVYVRRTNRAVRQAQAKEAAAAFNLSVNIFGEVVRPGMVPLTPFVEDPEAATLINIISMAGGFTKAAALTRVRVVRVEDGKETAIKINAKKILKGEAPDFHLKPGDVIVVPESYW